MNSNLEKRKDRLESLLRDMACTWVRTKWKSGDNYTYTVHIGDYDQFNINVAKPSMTKAALTWYSDGAIFSGSMDELEEYIETLRPPTNVVPIR